MNAPINLAIPTAISAAQLRGSSNNDTRQTHESFEDRYASLILRLERHVIVTASDIFIFRKAPAEIALLALKLDRHAPGFESCRAAFPLAVGVSCFLARGIALLRCMGHVRRLASYLAAAAASETLQARLFYLFTVSLGSLSAG